MLSPRHFNPARERLLLQVQGADGGLVSLSEEAPGTGPPLWRVYADADDTPGAYRDRERAITTFQIAFVDATDRLRTAPLPAWGIAYTTCAPEAYDGFGTQTVRLLPWATRTGARYRTVLIQPEHEAWQTMRYGSGLYHTFAGDFDPAVVQALLQLENLVLVAESVHGE